MAVAVAGVALVVFGGLHAWNHWHTYREARDLLGSPGTHNLYVVPLDWYAVAETVGFFATTVATLVMAAGFGRIRGKRRCLGIAGITALILGWWVAVSFPLRAAPIGTLVTPDLVRWVAAASLGAVGIATAGFSRRA